MIIINVQIIIMIIVCKKKNQALQKELDLKQYNNII